MAESTDHEAAAKTWKRRGIFAAAAAGVAGLVAKVTEQRAEAGTDGDVVLGTGNTTTGATGVTSTMLNGTGFTAQCTAGPNSVGLLGEANLYGVGGQSDLAGGAGVVGSAFNGLGVWGLTSGGTNSNTIAVYGVNASSYTGSVPGTGGFGVAGVSRYGHGVLGATSAAGAGAVVGATNGIAGAYAGIFFGPAVVEGNFTVIGGAKSAAVPHPDGSHRRLYCVESPESWFEDFGEGKLECGGATVTLDPDFVAVAETTTYHVFLTGYDDQYELCAADRTPSGFRVRTRSGDGNGTFSWRVVAKRKDIASPRFEPVSVPPKPEMPAIPDPPVPDLSRRPEVRLRRQ